VVGDVDPAEGISPVIRESWADPFRLKRELQGGPVFGASALTIFKFCFLSFFARLAILARRFLAFCFLRLLFSI
jgi:hypothetical protein